MRFWRGIKKFLIILGLPVYYLIKNLVPGMLIVIFGVCCIWLYFSVWRELPNVNEIYNPPKLSTIILDRNGNLLYKFYDDENRSWVPISKVPEFLIKATIAIEDKDFFRHQGISFRGISKAIIYNVFKKDGDNLRGGSTITQQLVKNVFLNHQQTIQRKIKEIILAVMIENKLNKEEILERYINQIAYGGETYGVEEAAIKYFGKDVWDISEAEAAFLAGLTAAPSSYSPFGNNPNFAYLRMKHVIEEMVSAGFISEEESAKVLQQKVTVVKEQRNIVAPHFVFYVKDYMEKRFGFRNFGRRGLVVTTSLDINWQTRAESIVSEEVNKVKKLNISNGGLVLVTPKNGDILAMVGSKGYYAKDIDGKYNVTTALRQPGSSIKPINYLLALKKGWTMASLIDDSPVIYQSKGQKPYAPQNYNGKFMGKVTLRTALAASLNVPSVKILAEDGVGDMIDLAEQMGITTWKERNRFGLALALGSGEVKMVDLAIAYGVFANLGKKVELNPILKINNYLGEEIYTKKVETDLVVDPKMAFIINDVLSDNNARAPIFGLNSKLKIEGKTVAVKTGTTNNLKDNWCIGWTPEVLTAAWVGNNDGSPMSWVASGVSGATPIWNRMMNEYLKNREEKKWEIPLGVYKYDICGREEYFFDNLEKRIKCPEVIRQ